MGEAYPDRLKWFKRPPTDPGFYWLAESGMPPHIVEVRIVSDTNNKLEILIPGDDQRYPVDMWPGALWAGPLTSPQ